MATVNKPQNLSYALVMLVLSAASIIALAATSAVNLNQEQKAILLWFDLLLCGIFFCDFLFCLYRAPDKRRYFLTWGWLDLVSSIPIVGPFRAARFARIVRVVRLLRGIRAARIFAEFAMARRKQNAFLAASLLSLLILVSAALAVLHVETSPSSNIKTAEDALWWGIATMTTVGYGDRFPITTEGRVIGAVLMIFGLGMFGVFSGFMASWLLGSSEDNGGSSEKLDQIKEEIRALRHEIAQIRKKDEDNPKPPVEPL